MPTRTVLVATWSDGLFVSSGDELHQELAGQPVSALVSDGHGGALAIVSEHSLRRRTADGEWLTITTSELQLACCAPVADVISTIRHCRESIADNASSASSLSTVAHQLPRSARSFAGPSDRQSDRLAWIGATPVRSTGKDRQRGAQSARGRPETRSPVGPAMKRARARNNSRLNRAD
jgi:hypothetical protein